MVDTYVLPSTIAHLHSGLISGEKFLEMASPYSDSGDVTPLVIEEGTIAI